MRFPIRLLAMDGEVLVSGEKRYRASLKASTRATFSLSNRAYFFEGNAETGLKNGDYCHRWLGNDDGGLLLCMGVHDEPHYAGMDYVFFARCNTSGRFARYRDGTLSVYTDWVPVYKVTTTRDDKAQNDGLLDQTIYVCYLPAAVGARKDDIVQFSSSVESKPMLYRVDSVDDGLRLDGSLGRGGVVSAGSHLSDSENVERTLLAPAGPATVRAGSRSELAGASPTSGAVCLQLSAYHERASMVDDGGSEWGDLE